MNAVSGTRRAIKELVDGTIRVQVDIDPRFRAAFFTLFPNIDSPIALAPLVNDFEQPKPETDAAVQAAAKAAVKGGELARLAGILCSTEEFREWMHDRHQVPCDAMGDVTEEAAADALRRICGVASRAELDHNAEAAAKFHEIRKAWVGSGWTR